MCYRVAGFHSSVCHEFQRYCDTLDNYCDRNCYGEPCSLSRFKLIHPPLLEGQGKTSLSYSYYPCPTFEPVPPTTEFPEISNYPSTATRNPTSNLLASPTHPAPASTSTNICIQPNNPAGGYNPSNPVGNVPLPVLTCNNDRSDFEFGRPFKLYLSSNHSKCPSYQRSGDYGPAKACRDACDDQFKNCVGTYAESCKGFGGKWKAKRSGKDDYSSAIKRCKNQRDDCYSANSGVIGGSKCNRWGGS